MDIHRLEGTAPEAVAKAHLEDLKAQEKYGVRYLRYWFNERVGQVFCLVEAPDAAAATAVHREAHGLVADQIIEAEARTVDGFLRDSQEAPEGAALQPHGSALDTGARTLLFTDIEGWTPITERLGDAEALKVLRAHDVMIRDAIASRGGREVKHTGNGFMAPGPPARRPPRPPPAAHCAVRCDARPAGEYDTLGANGPFEFLICTRVPAGRGEVCRRFVEDLAAVARKGSAPLRPARRCVEPFGQARVARSDIDATGRHSKSQNVEPPDATKIAVSCPKSTLESTAPSRSMPRMSLTAPLSASYVRPRRLVSDRSDRAIT